MTAVAAQAATMAAEAVAAMRLDLDISISSLAPLPAGRFDMGRSHSEGLIFMKYEIVLDMSKVSNYIIHNEMFRTGVVQ
jgi:hypothetical protein